MRFLAGISLFFSIGIKSMEFIDSEGKSYQLTKAQANIFLASNLGQQLKDDIDRGNKVDFSQLRRPGLGGKNIVRVLSNTQDPSQLTLTSEVVPEEMAILETAHILGLEDQTCARHLAYRLWPLVQKSGPNPMDLSYAKKRYVHDLARIYMPCPATMLEYLKDNENSKIVSDNLSRLLMQVFNYSPVIDLSYETCCRTGYVHKFGNLNGLKELIAYIFKMRHGRHDRFDLYNIIFDGHMLDSFSLKQINESVNLRKLSLRRNLLTELSERQIDTPDLPQELDFSMNPITYVADGMFQAINRYRARHRIRFEFMLSLEYSSLSAKQKSEIQSKFYNATHTIPERWTIDRKIVVYKWLLALAPFYMLFNDPRYFEDPTPLRATIGLFTLWLWWDLFMNKFDMRLAKIAHPTIANHWGGGDIHDRSWTLWPKNNSKLLI